MSELEVKALEANFEGFRKDRLAALMPVALKPLDEKMMEECLELVLLNYELLGGNDKIAKGPMLLDNIKTALAAKFGAIGTLL